MLNHGDVRTYQSTSSRDGWPGYRERSGMRVIVLRALNEDEVDMSEVGQMYTIRFEDGVETDAFEDELTS
jgi:hypothetical protein